ncbi:hypothetical protein CMQ_6614 [Grosmannia clavigera kw1407]|uniref:Uncharacterized protein n=1 Tax=Grosmannia clavigera (strain kw1407 / UAMH 11150) TaxID=655863 RepID=F0X7N3_GROCL|nr:uncharacterized protein CMQ_6614 [Grosmannia clavigera kw1407]EFX06293.1 hypothetical protein CMQ_6614 [Grosmannia clavigera kw1407]
MQVRFIGNHPVDWNPTTTTDPPSTAVQTEEPIAPNPKSVGENDDDDSGAPRTDADVWEGFKQFLKAARDNLLPHSDDDGVDYNTRQRMNITLLLEIMEDSSTRIKRLSVTEMQHDFMLYEHDDNLQNLRRFYRSVFAVLDFQLTNALKGWLTKSKQARETADRAAQRQVPMWYGGRCFLSGTIDPQGAHIVPVQQQMQKQIRQMQETEKLIQEHQSVMYEHMQKLAAAVDQQSSTGAGKGEPVEPPAKMGPVQQKTAFNATEGPIDDILRGATQAMEALNVGGNSADAGLGGGQAAVAKTSPPLQHDLDLPSSSKGKGKETETTTAEKKSGEAVGHDTLIPRNPEQEKYKRMSAQDIQQHFHDGLGKLEDASSSAQKQFSHEKTRTVAHPPSQIPSLRQALQLCQAPCSPLAWGFVYSKARLPENTLLARQI